MRSSITARSAPSTWPTTISRPSLTTPFPLSTPSEPSPSTVTGSSSSTHAPSPGSVAFALSPSQIISFSSLPDDIFEPLRNLTVLHFSNNRLEHVWIRTFFAGLRSLRMLNLSGNRLGNLPDGVFHDSPGLVRLALDGNRLKTF